MARLSWSYFGLDVDCRQTLKRSLKKKNLIPKDAIGVLKHADLWARGGTDSFVEVKAWLGLRFAGRRLRDFQGFGIWT